MGDLFKKHEHHPRKENIFWQAIYNAVRKLPNEYFAKASDTYIFYKVIFQAIHNGVGGLHNQYFLQRHILYFFTW